MIKEEQKNKKNSAYDAYLRSGAADTVESDIAYFDASREKKREHSPAPAASRARKDEKHRTAQRDTHHESALQAQQPARRHAHEQKAPTPQSEQAAQRAKKRAAKCEKERRLYTIVSAAIIACFLVFAGVFTLAGKQKQYSEDENRHLATRPKADAASVADGSYMKDMESYLSDQFVARSSLVKIRTDIDLFFGKKEINDVYIGKEHFLFEKPADYNADAVEQTINAINAFASKNDKLNTYVAIAPDASEILADLMPANAPITDEQKRIKSIYKKCSDTVKTIDICSTLKNNDKKQSLYYRTDHHWTTKAAEISFRQIAANMKLDTQKVTYKTYAVTNDFRGTLAASSGLFNAKDRIDITVPETKLKYVVSYVEENKKSASMFVSEKLSQKNQYEVFFGGNFAEVKIDTTLNSNKVLLVIKDSYANCLVPMLTPYYKTIVMVDPRYFNGDIQSIVKDEGVTDILWLYNINTFIADTSIKAMFE